MIYTENFGSHHASEVLIVTHVNNGRGFGWYHTWNHCGYYRMDYLRSEASEGLSSRFPIREEQRLVAIHTCQHYTTSRNTSRNPYDPQFFRSTQSFCTTSNNP